MLFAEGIWQLWESCSRVKSLECAELLILTTDFSVAFEFFVIAVHIYTNHAITCILQEIPSNGIDKWFKLEGRSAKSRVRGDCHIKITLTTGKVCGVPDWIAPK